MGVAEASNPSPYKFDLSYRRLLEKLIAQTSLGRLLTFEYANHDGQITALSHLDVRIIFRDVAAGSQVRILGPRRRHESVQYEYKCAPAATPFPYATAVAKIAEKVEVLLRQAIDNAQRCQENLDAEARFMGWWRTVPGVTVAHKGPSGDSVGAPGTWRLHVTRYLGEGKQLELHHPAGWFSRLLQGHPEEWAIDLRIRITEANVKEVLTFLAAYITLPGQR